MRKALVLSSVIAFTTLVASPPAGAIVDGQPDGNRHPNVGAFVVEIDGEKVHISSGTLIAPDVFLTDTSTLFPGTTHTHPDFGFSGPGGFSDPHDIAVIELDDPVPGITPAQLPSLGLLDQLKASKELRGETFTAVGYGTVRETRKKAFQNVLDNDERRFGLQHMLALQPAWLQLCMNQATGDAGTCFGDSGGPHFLGGVSSNCIVSITVTGDRWCKATDTTYRVERGRAAPRRRPPG